MTNRINYYIFAVQKTIIMKLKMLILIVFQCIGLACFGVTVSNQTAINKQVIVVWLNNDNIIKTGVYFDTADIEKPNDVMCEQGKHFVRWERTNNFHLDFISDTVEKIIYKAVFANNEQRNYTVNHYKEKIQDTLASSFSDNYELALSEQKQGSWGTTTSAVAQNYSGYITPIVNQQIINENDSTVVNLYYDRETYTLTWNTNGGIVTNSFAFGVMKYGTEITIPQLIRPGYSYNWDQPIPETLSDNAFFSAIWTAKKYEVKWLMNDGTDSIFDAKYIDYGTIIEISGEDPSRTGYEFNGWAATPTSRFALTDFGELTAADTVNKMFYAVWEPNTYEVLWLYNNGDDSIFHKDFVRFDSVICAPESDPTRIGYIFSGWGLQFNSDSAITDFGTLTDLEGKNYYALWEPGDTIMPSKKLIINETYSPPATKKARKMAAYASEDSNYAPATVSTNMFVSSTAIVTPNPTDGKAYYQNPNMKIGDVISIYDDNGKLIIKQTVANVAVEEIDLQNQPRGVYFIELNGERLKIIKM